VDAEAVTRDEQFRDGGAFDGGVELVAQVLVILSEDFEAFEVDRRGELRPGDGVGRGDTDQREHGQRCGYDEADHAETQQQGPG